MGGSMLPATTYACGRAKGRGWMWVPRRCRYVWAFLSGTQATVLPCGLNARFHNKHLHKSDQSNPKVAGTSKASGSAIQNRGPFCPGHWTSALVDRLAH